jgi:hypothetical protein
MVRSKTLLKKGFCTVGTKLLKKGFCSKRCRCPQKWERHNYKTTRTAYAMQRTAGAARAKTAAAGT